MLLCQVVTDTIYFK